MDLTRRMKAMLDESSSPEPPAATPGVAVNGRGAVGFVGNNNTVTIMNGSAPPAPAVTVPVRPGVDHITDQQAARIQELVGIAAGRGRRHFAAIYGDLFRHLGGGHKLVPSYRLIPLEMYPKAEKFLTDIAEGPRG